MRKIILVAVVLSLAYVGADCKLRRRDCIDTGNQYENPTAAAATPAAMLHDATTIAGTTNSYNGFDFDDGTRRGFFLDDPSANTDYTFTVDYTGRLLSHDTYAEFAAFLHFHFDNALTVSDIANLHIDATWQG